MIDDYGRNIKCAYCGNEIPLDGFYGGGKRYCDKSCYLGNNAAIKARETRAATASMLSEENFKLRQDVQNLEEALYALQSKFDFLDKKCKESNTGVTIERWNAFGRTGNKEGVRYRLMWNGHIGNAADSLMHCIENEMKV